MTVAQFAQVLRQLREERGWSQEHLAERANLNRSYLGEVERGCAVPSLLTLDKLAIALGVRLSFLIACCEHSKIHEA
jgi:transcriptional regulator with XRE-family HTH domain